MSEHDEIVDVVGEEVESVNFVQIEELKRMILTENFTPTENMALKLCLEKGK